MSFLRRVLNFLVSTLILKSNGFQNRDTRAREVRFDEDSMWVGLDDGRVLGVPLAWFPRLFHATAQQRADCRISARGLHWEALDEDISIAGLLAGRGDETHRPRAVPSAA